MSRYNVGGTAQWLFQLSHGLSENKIENRMLVGNCPNGEIEDERLSSINHTKIAGLKHLRYQGIFSAMLYVDELNNSAIKLYQSLGFKEWGRDVLYRLAN